MNFRSIVPFRGNQNVTRPGTDVFGSLQREVDRLFEEFAHGFGPLAGANGNFMPSMDIDETDKAFVITTELPGLERKDVEISLDDNVLTIRGEKKIESSPNDKNKNEHVSERSYGVFYRAVQLPMDVDPKSVQATMSNGVLKITIPRPAQPQSKKIEIKEAA